MTTNARGYVTKTGATLSYKQRLTLSANAFGRESFPYGRETVKRGSQMTIAKTIKDSIERECPTCFSLYAGCGENNGEYVRWPTGVQLHEKRNDKGLVIKAAYQYADDSVLHYSYNANTERYALTAKEGVK